MKTVTNSHRAMRDVEHAHELLIAIAYYWTKQNPA
jgi:hypothetical protein